MTNAGLLALCLCAAPSIVSAQTMQWTDRGFITVNGGFQGGSHDLNTTSSFPLYDETANVSSAQTVKGGGFFDIGGAYRVWGRNLLAGVSVSHTTSDADVTINGSIPDPVVFDSPRTVNSTVPGASHAETAIHLAAIWMVPVANKFDVGVFAGPTIFSVKQDTVSTLSVTEPGPNVTANLTEEKKTTVGINLGVDLQYMVNRRIGVGGLARYSWGSADLDSSEDSLTLGGFQIGGGVRFRF